MLSRQTIKRQTFIFPEIKLSQERTLTKKVGSKTRVNL